MSGDDLEIEELRREIEGLQQKRDEYFRLGFLPQKRANLVAVAELCAVFGGLSALISILMHGVGWISAIFIVAGAWVLYIERQRNSTRDFLRNEYRKADAKLEDLKYELGKRTVDLASSEAAWLDLLHGGKTSGNP